MKPDTASHHSRQAGEPRKTMIPTMVSDLRTTATTSRRIKISKSIQDILRDLLLKAGDIEENPGPSEQRCQKCAGVIKDRAEFLKCGNCKMKFHKQHKCSGEKRSKVDGMSRRNKEKWKCEYCTGRTTHRENGESARQDPQGEEKRKCKMCKGVIKRGADCLQCIGCKNTIHKQLECSGETRESIQRLDRTVWKCKGCMQAEEERNKRKNANNVEEEEVEYIMKGEANKNTSIRILQWNADSFLSKKEEFREVIKKQKIDVFLVQETKMTTTDRTPSFPGYTILSKPRSQTTGNERNRGGGLLIGIRQTIPYREIKDSNLREKKMV